MNLPASRAKHKLDWTEINMKRQGIIDPRTFEIIDTYLYHDRPLLYTCESPDGDLYLGGLFTDMYEPREGWAFVRVTSEWLSGFSREEISLDLAMSPHGPEDRETVFCFESDGEEPYIFTLYNKPPDNFSISPEELARLEGLAEEALARGERGARTRAITLGSGAKLPPDKCSGDMPDWVWSIKRD